MTTLGELIHWAELMAEEFKYWDDADTIRSFGKTWRDLQSIRLEDVSITLNDHSKGQWALDIDDSFSLLRRGWKCSKCGRRQTYGTTPYCPYCGRKMEVKR